MRKIIIRKVLQSDAYSLSCNIFPKSTVYEVEEQLKESLKGMKEGKLIHLVAIYEDSVVGNIKIIKQQHILYSHRCMVMDMIVSPSFQKMGIAKSLFEEGCKFSQELNFNYVMATCRGDGTEKFYKAIGMNECGRIPNGIYEPWSKNIYDEIILCKELE